MKISGATLKLANANDLRATVSEVMQKSFMNPSERRKLLHTYERFGMTEFDPLGAAMADPRGHKLTKLTWPKSARYRFYGNPLSGYRESNHAYDSRGWEVRFCWSTVRNQAGYFLSWVERIPPPQSKAKSHEPQRTQWAARRVRKRAKALALRRATAFQKKLTTQKGLTT